MLNNDFKNRNPIQLILSSWTQAIENEDGAGVSTAIHQLKENITDQVVQEIFTGLKKHPSPSKSFGLNLINEEDKDLVMQDLDIVLKKIFSFYDKDSVFAYYDVGDLYSTLQQYQLEQLASRGDTQSYIDCIQSMPNENNKKTLTQKIFNEAIKKTNRGLIDALISNNLIDFTKIKVDLNFCTESPEKMNLALKFIKLGCSVANSIKALGHKQRTKLLKILIEKELLNLDEPFDDFGTPTPFIFWIIKHQPNIIPFLIENRGEDFVCKMHNDTMWIEQVADKIFFQVTLSSNKSLSNLLSSDNLLSNLICSPSFYQKFAITSRERLNRAIKSRWPLNLILRLIPKTNTPDLQGAPLHGLITQYSGRGSAHPIGLFELLTEIITRLVEANADINALDEGQTILDKELTGFYQTNLYLVKELLKLGATTAKKPPLFSIWYHSNADAATLINQRYLDPNDVDEEGNTLLHKLFLNFSNPAATGDPSVSGEAASCNKIMMLLKSGANPHLPNLMGITAFHQALTSPKSHHSLIHSMLLTFKHLYFKSENKQELSPLHLAIFENSIKEVERVLNTEDLNVNQADKNGVTPLHLALDSGNKELVIMLLKKGANVNCQDSNGVTPLHIAALHQSTDMLNLLIENLEMQQPNIKAACLQKELKNKLTPLKIAFIFKNFELVERITRDIDLKDLSISSLIAEFVSPETEKEKQIILLLIERGWIPKQDDASSLRLRSYYFAISKIFSRKNINLDVYKHLENRTRFLGHALEIKGSITHTDVQSNQRIPGSINVEGQYAELNMEMFSKATVLFFKEFPEIALPSSLCSEIKYLLNYGANIHSYSPQQILNRIQSMESVMLPTGFYMHSTEALFTHDKEGNPVFGLCNRGGENRKPIELFHYEPSLLTPELITRILQAADSSSFDFRDFFYNQLPILLSFTPAEHLQKMESDCPLKAQTVGNCSWASIEAAVWILFQFAAQKIGTERSLMVQYGNLIYTHWRLFLNIIQMENYLQHIEDARLSPDQDSFLKDFQNLWRAENDPTIDSRLRHRILKLHKRCFALFPTRMENPVPSGWIKAQKAFWNTWENLSTNLKNAIE